MVDFAQIKIDAISAEGGFDQNKFIDLLLKTSASVLNDSLNDSYVCVGGEVDGFEIVASNEDDKLAQIRKLKSEDEKNVFDFAFKNNDEEMMAALLSCLDLSKQSAKSRYIINLLSLILENKYYDALVTLNKIVNKKLKENDDLCTEIKIFILMSANFDYTNESLLLALAMMPGDLVYKIKEFDHLIKEKSVNNVIDNEKNNLYHLAIIGGNKYFLQWLINKYGHNALYQHNEEGKTPIHLAYELAKQEDGKYDYSMLALLDQCGADLKMHGYDNDIYQSYSRIPMTNMLATQPKLAKHSITALNFNGGGVKGVAFIGALLQATKEGLIDLHDIKSVAGTSAGSLAAALLAMGKDLNDCNTILNEFDFNQLMNRPAVDKNKLCNILSANLGKWLSLYDAGNTKQLWSEMRSELANIGIEYVSAWFKDMLPGSPKGERDRGNGLLNITGVFDPSYMEEQLKAHLSQQLKGTKFDGVDPAFITLEDVSKLADTKDSKFKTFITYATNLTAGVVEEYSANKTPKISFIDAVMSSMSFPVFFKAREKREVVVEDGVRKFKPVLINEKPVYCCDGGILKNDPVDAHDSNGFNDNALSFLLVSSTTKEKFENGKSGPVKDVSTLLNVFSQLFTVQRGAERARIHEDPRNTGRIIYIDTKNIDTLDFKNAEKNKEILVKSGESAVIDYMNRSVAHVDNSLSPQLMRLLINYGLEVKPETHGDGLSIKIPTKQFLTPVKVLLLYACADKKDLAVLRRLVNPNCRDNDDVSAISLAHTLGWQETVDKLLKSGSNPIRSTLLTIPDIFKKNKDEIYAEQDMVAMICNLSVEGFINNEKEKSKSLSQAGQLNAKVDSFKRKYEVEKKDKERLKSEIETINKTNRELLDKNKKLKDETNEIRMNLHKLTDENNSLNKKISSLMFRLKKLVWRLFFSSVSAGVEHKKHENLARQHQDLHAQHQASARSNERLSAENISLDHRLRSRDGLLGSVRMAPNSSVSKAIAKLKEHRNYLKTRKHKYRDLNESHRYDDHLSRIKQKRGAIKSIVNNLESDLSRSAGEIINNELANRPGLYQSYWFGWFSNTRHYCHAIEKDEQEIVQKCGY